MTRNETTSSTYDIEWCDYINAPTVRKYNNASNKHTDVLLPAKKNRITVKIGKIGGANHAGSYSSFNIALACHRPCLKKQLIRQGDNRRTTSSPSSCFIKFALHFISTWKWALFCCGRCICRVGLHIYRCIAVAGAPCRCYQHACMQAVIEVMVYWPRSLQYT